MQITVHKSPQCQCGSGNCPPHGICPPGQFALEKIVPYGWFALVLNVLLSVNCPPLQMNTGMPANKGCIQLEGCFRNQQWKQVGNPTYRKGAFLRLDIAFLQV